MELSKNSWHYKLLRWRHVSKQEIEDQTLCEYFWLVIQNIFIILMGSAIIILFGILVVLILLTPFINVFHAVDAPALIISYLIWTLIYLIPLVGANKYLANCDKYDQPYPFWGKTYRRLFKRPKIKGPKQLGLLKSYMKAKKDKICPLITWTD